MTRRPSFQFYPADWANDSKLQVCSMSAQGMLINMMCHMHQSNEYGFLIINGTIPEPKTIAKLLRISPKKFQKWSQELVQNGVVKNDERGAFFCQRMVEDEELREVRRQCGKLGGNPNLLNQRVNQGSNQNPTPSSSPSSSSSKQKNSSSSDTEYYETKRGRKLNGTNLEQFNLFWDAFNYKQGKAAAADTWLDIKNMDNDLFARIIEAAKAEAKRRSGLIVKGQTPKMAQGWLSERRWEDEPDTAGPKLLT